MFTVVAMVTESLIKQVQLLELLGYPLPRGQAGLTDAICRRRFDSENHIHMCPGSQPRGTHASTSN